MFYSPKASADADKSEKSETKDKREEKTPKEDRKDRDRSDRDRDRGERSHPPAKRPRDDHRDNRYNERYYDGRSGSAPRGREFVRGARGRGRGRGIRGGSNVERGYSRGASGRGQRGRGREYRSYDNHMDFKSENSRGPRQGGPSYADQARPFNIANWNGEENEPQEEVEEVSKRLRDKDEESDLSGDELSGGSCSESSTEKLDSRENSQPKEKEVKDNKRNQNEDRRPKRDDYRENYYNADQGNDYSNRGYYREDSYRGRGGYIPKGEPSRHGRGRGG